MARFYENESWASSPTCFSVMSGSMACRAGLYVDQHGIYRPIGEPTDAELLDNAGRKRNLVEPCGNWTWN